MVCRVGMAAYRLGGRGGQSQWGALSCTVLAAVVPSPPVPISARTFAISSSPQIDSAAGAVGAASVVTPAALSATTLRAPPGFAACHWRSASTQLRGTTSDRELQAGPSCGTTPADPLDALDGGPGGRVGGESDEGAPPGSLGSLVGRHGWLGPARRPRWMALRSSSLSRGRPRRCTS